MLNDVSSYSRPQGPSCDAIQGCKCQCQHARMLKLVLGLYFQMRMQGSACAVQPHYRGMPPRGCAHVAARPGHSISTSGRGAARGQRDHSLSALSGAAYAGLGLKLAIIRSRRFSCCLACRPWPLVRIYTAGGPVLARL